MSGSKTKAVGGQAVNPVAQQYQSFLGNALGQTGAATTGINSLLSGGSNGMNLQQLQQLQNFQLPNVTAPTGSVNLNLPSAPNLGTFSNSNGVGSFQLPGQQALTPTTQNPNANLLGLSGIGSQANQNDTTGLAALLASINNPQYQAQSFQSSSPDVNGTYANALSSIISNQQNNDVNSLREHFNATGGGAGIGTPGAYAEAVYRAQAAPQIAAALGNLNLQQNAQNLQAQGLNLQSTLGTQSQNLQSLAQLAQNLGAAGGLVQNQNNSGLQNQLGNRQIDASQLANVLGLMQQSNTANQNTATQYASLGLDQRNQDINALLGARGQDANLAASNNANNLAARGQDASYNSNNQNNILQLLQLALSQQQGLNTGNLQSQLANINNAQSVQQNLLNVAGLGFNQNQLSQQGQIAALQQLFGGINQTNALGTTQAQTIQQPSSFQNFISGLQGVTGLASSVAPLFNSGGGNPTPLNLSGYTPNSLLPQVNTTGLYR